MSLRQNIMFNAPPRKNTSFPNVTIIPLKKAWWRARDVASKKTRWHYNDVIMSMRAYQITNFTIVYSTVYSGADQRKHQSSASLAFVRGIHRWLVNSPHKGQWRAKCFHLMMSTWKSQFDLFAIGGAGVTKPLFAIPFFPGFTKLLERLSSIGYHVRTPLGKSNDTFSLGMDINELMSGRGAELIIKKQLNRCLELSLPVCETCIGFGEFFSWVDPC